MPEPGTPESLSQRPQVGPQCPWCAAPNLADAANCRACGAAIAQRESIGGLKIAGLTSVDASLEDFDKRPLHLRGPSPSQGMAPALIIGAAAGGPIGLVAIGGVAAVAAAEFLGSKREGVDGPSLEDVGKPSEALLRALEQAEDEGTATPGDDPAALLQQEPDAGAIDGGRSIWRDLPTHAKPLPIPDEPGEAGSA